MDPRCLNETEAALSASDRRWRGEVTKRFGPDGVLLFGYLPQAQGESGTPMRLAFEARMKAIAAWRQARHHTA